MEIAESEARLHEEWELKLGVDNSASRRALKACFSPGIFKVVVKQVNRENFGFHFL
jgi:hypothetical protein